MNRNFKNCLLVGLACSMPLYAGGVKYQNGSSYFKLGGRIQMQYHQKDPSGGPSTDSIAFRRLRPYIEGSTNRDWKAKFQWDMGKGKVEIKDAYIEYKGLQNTKIKLGNHGVPFSLEYMTSSKKQQLVERTFVGDHNYGTPDRAMGVFLSGKSKSKKFDWAGSATQSAQDPSNKKLDFDTPASLNKGKDWSEGWMLTGRVGYHPFGNLKMSQGDFKGKTLWSFYLATFSWSNDGDNLDSARGDDVDSVTGLELSSAFRYSGLSVDFEYNKFESNLVDSGITSGLYKNSSTTLDNYSLEAGYMVLPKKLELVFGMQNQKADGYAEAWERKSFGLNYFLTKNHDVKYQLTFRQGENVDGVSGKDLDEIFAQAQFVF